MLYTDRRFGPTAFYQAALNVFTIVAALSAVEASRRLCVRHRLHRGRCGAARHRLVRLAPRARYRESPECQVRWREILVKPAFFVVYAAGLGA